MELVPDPLLKEPYSSSEEGPDTILTVGETAASCEGPLRLLSSLALRSL